MQITGSISENLTDSDLESSFNFENLQKSHYYIFYKKYFFSIEEIMMIYNFFKTMD